MKKVLVIRYSSIGDIVLTTPIIRCLYEQMDVEIHFLTKRSMSQLLVHHPYIHKVHSIARDNKELIGQLLAEGFDIVVDLHKNLRSRQIRKSLASAQYYTFDKLNVGKWLLVNLKWDRLPDIHIVERYFDGLKGLELLNDGRGLDHYIAEADEAYGSMFCREHGEYTVLVLGANYYTKRPPLELWQDVITRYTDRKFVLLGGQDVAALADELSAYEHVINRCGKTSLGQSASIIKRATQVVSGDTGLMHIAAAYRVPLVSIWGSTVPKLGMYPYYGDQEADHKLLQHDGLGCRPCSKLGHDRCPKGHFKCMRELKVTL